MLLHKDGTLCFKMEVQEVDEMGEGEKGDVLKDI